MVTRLGLRRTFRYGCALMAFLYVTVSILIDIGRVKRRKDDSKQHTRSYTVLIGLLAVSYITEVATIAAQENNFRHSQAHIIHMTSLTVIWSIVRARQNIT